MDDPLRGLSGRNNRTEPIVLSPLLVDDPLRDAPDDIRKTEARLVLIPLLVDDPLWEFLAVLFVVALYGLNPSFSG